MLFRSEEHTSELQSHDNLVCSSDRKSTRLNSSHTIISYAVFCLKKKNTHSPTGPLNGDSTTATLEEENSMNIEAFKQVSLNDITFFFLNNRAPPDIYTLSPHDAFPI